MSRPRRAFSPEYRVEAAHLVLDTLSQPVVDAMWASGLMPAVNPVAAGGAESPFAEMIETWIEMAWQQGPFGWAGIANLPSSFAAATYLPDGGFAEVFTANQNRVTMGGQFAPNGQGLVADGGYRLTGACGGHHLHSRGQPLGARVPRHLPRNPARVHAVICTERRCNESPG